MWEYIMPPQVSPVHFVPCDVISSFFLSLLDSRSGRQVVIFGRKTLNHKLGCLHGLFTFFRGGNRNQQGGVSL